MAEHCLLERKGDQVVLSNGFTFKIDPGYSAVGLLARLASPLHQNETLVPPHIIGVKGDKRPLFVYEGDCRPKTRINMELIFDTNRAERKRWQVVEHIKHFVLPKSAAACAEMKRVKKAHMKIDDQYLEYRYVNYSGREGGVTFNWLEAKPSRMMHVAVASQYRKTEAYSGKWWSKLAFWDSIVKRALFNTLPHEMLYMKGYDGPGMLNIVLNGREYLFIYQSKGAVRALTPYQFPNLWGGEAFKTIEIA